MDVDEDNDNDILCATYTHARRHPMVMGQIGGWTPPFQLTLTQLAVVVVTFVIEMRTWQWWGAFLPRMAGVLFALTLPCVLAWAVRRTRIEGRSLPRFAVGWLSYMSMPRSGRVGGRPDRQSRPLWPTTGSVYVAPGEDRR
jgi:hypothetical protein